MAVNESSFRILLVLVVGSAVSCGSPRSYLERGNAYFANGKYNDASLNYRKAIQKDSQFGEAYYRLALTNLRMGNAQVAYSALVQAVDLLPDRDDAKIQLGNVALAFYLKDPERSQFLYDQLTKVSQQLLAKHPDSYDGLRFQGHIAQTNGKLKDAIEIFGRANRVKPMQPDVIIPLAEALFVDGQVAEGERLMRDLLRQRKDFRLGYQFLYTHYMAQKQSDEGEKLLLTRIANNPKDVEAFLQLAFHYNQVKKRAEMQGILQRVLDNRQDFPQARLSVGAFYATLAEREEALRQFQSGLREDPKNNLLYLKAIGDVENGMAKREEAVKAFEEILKVHPKDQEIRTSRAIVLLDMNRPEKADVAIHELQSLLAEKPADPELEFHLGRGFSIKGDLTAAKGSLQSAVAHRAGYLPALLLLAENTSKQQAYAETLRYADAALAAARDSLDAQYWRGVGLKGTGNYQESRSVFNGVLKINPKYTDAELQLGLLDLTDRKLSDAESRFRRVYQSSQDPRSMDGLVQAYTAEKDPAKAMQFLRAELQKSPNSVPAHVLLAITAARSSDWDTAIEQYRWLISTDSKALGLYIQLAQAYQAKGSYRNAIDAFQKARELNPTDGRTSASIAFLQETLGQREAAQASYRQALSLSPDNPDILNNLAFLIVETNGNSDEALSLARKARSKAPDNPDLNDTLGWVYLKRNETEAALQVFNNLIRKYPDQPVYRYHLGVAFLQKGDTARAQTEFKTALTKGPSRDIESKIRDLLARRG
jgi:tetratricopeptide (TPR) repeat protein